MAEKIAQTMEGERGTPSNLRSTIAWTIYALGWVVCFVSLWMPGVAFGTTGAYVVLWYLMLMAATTLFGRAGATPELAPVFWIYYLGAIASLVAGFYRPTPAAVRWCIRTASLGLLVAPAIAWLYLWSPSRPLFFGLPTLALGSMLIFIGVWLIPPRKNDRKAAGKGGKQRTAIDANRDS
jgi:hypothetical protein